VENTDTQNMMNNYRVEFENFIISKYNSEFRHYVHGIYSGPPYEPGSETELDEIDLIIDFELKKIKL
jgi:hypothetical protein